MNLNFQAGSSPLSSRQNPVIYLVIIFALVIAAVFLVVWIFFQVRKKTEETPEFKEKEAKRATKLKDVKKLSEKYKLSKDYIPILWFVCKTFKVPNILYSVKNFDKLDETFKKAYFMLKTNSSDQKINSLFKLKFNLDKIFAETVIYTSTRAIPENTKMNLLLKRGEKIPCTLEENTENYISIEIPAGFYESEEKPEQMERIAFVFSSPTGMPHAFITRVMRYQNQGEKKTMIVSHSKEIITKAQRHNKRVPANEDCRFSSVSIKKDNGGKRVFVKGNKKYNGKLVNISGGGCCISTNLPIKEGQLLSMEFDLYDGTLKTIGRIVKTRKTARQGIYNLHIKYMNLDISSQNKILAKVYGYE